MKQISDPAKQVTDNLEYMIQNTEVPELNLGERIVEQMNHANTELNRRNRSKNNRIKRVVAASGVAAALGFGIIGSGFVSPVMANALSQVPLIGNIFQQYGDPGLQASVANGLYQPVQAKDSHNDMTFESTGYIYDGTRISIALKRDGQADAKLLGERMDNGDTDISGKGVLKDIRMYINGKEYFTGSYTMSDGDTRDTAILEFNDSLPITLPNADPDDVRRPEPLGDSFELKLEATLTGAEQPYVLTFPVKKNTENLVLKPEAVKSHDGFRFALDKLELTPITTRLTITGQGELASLGDEYKLPDEELYAGKHRFGFDICDESNNLLEELPGNLMNFIGGQYVFDYSFTPFKETPKSITIKPYVLSQDKSSGKYKEKKYLSELEFHVDVN
ncbi:DUF4179 domain-containing protein [Paenibacillus oralis]|uniref:DUF4179 domain-containing protein n=1 Tax=Paenibacillus oralis TaxID=2490856 RepID=A0A3P3U1X1_9BACL|nr:DUF4179 domain-containing protein [Paenibacillus oralis]RRJ62563.1 DUF4179 domain-containing protein [Paenibacillus oralis]